MRIEYIKDLIQSCNINFMVGSGCSVPYLTTLTNIETLLTDLEAATVSDEKRALIKASIYKKYCEDVLFKNTTDRIATIKDDIINYDPQYLSVLNNYKKLLVGLNEILLHRNNTLLSKQINIFTTNVDLFFEKSLEEKGLESNDGFKGRIKPTYDLSNFHKSYSKRSSHYDNVSEIPVFNLLKIHGSLNWKRDNGDIIADNDLTCVTRVFEDIFGININSFIKINETSTIVSIINDINKIKDKDIADFSSFFLSYEKLLIVNPTKLKFKTTVFEEQYYELLRIYSNSLEKENTILFVMGFSFADEHIASITKRVADSNPTLQIIIFAYKDEDEIRILDKLQLNDKTSRNSNISVVTPSTFVASNLESDEKYIDSRIDKTPLNERLKAFTCETIANEIIAKIKNSVVFKYD